MGFKTRKITKMKEELQGEIRTSYKHDLYLKIWLSIKECREVFTLTVNVTDTSVKPKNRTPAFKERNLKSGTCPGHDDVKGALS